jgi:TRAP-type C4-dicarboxylate transport system permease small subunit
LKLLSTFQGGQTQERPLLIGSGNGQHFQIWRLLYGAYHAHTPNKGNFWEVLKKYLRLSLRFISDVNETEGGWKNMSGGDSGSSKFFEKAKSPYANVDACVKRITKVLSWVAGGAVLSLFLLELGNVLLRAIFNSPFRHTDEILRFNMAWIVYLGFAYTLRTGGHIAIDVFTSKVPQDLRKNLNKVSVIIVAVWVTMICYGGWKLWLDIFAKKQLSYGLLQVELWIPGLCIILGLSCFLLEALKEMVRELLGIRVKKSD